MTPVWLSTFLLQGATAAIRAVTRAEVEEIIVKPAEGKPWQRPRARGDVLRGFGIRMRVERRDPNAQPRAAGEDGYPGG